MEETTQHEELDPGVGRYGRRLAHAGDPGRGAQAAGPVPANRQTQTANCVDGGSVTIVAPPAAAGDNWSAAQIVGRGHLVPVAFRYYVYDQTAGVVLGDDTVTHAHAHQEQTTTTCTETQTAILVDLLPPDASLPPGVVLTDAVALSFEVTAVVQR